MNSWLIAAVRLQVFPLLSERHVLLWAVLEGPRGTQSKQVLTNQVTDGFQQLPRQVHLPSPDAVTRGNKSFSRAATTFSFRFPPLLFLLNLYQIFLFSLSPPSSSSFLLIFLSFVSSSSSTMIHQVSRMFYEI